jgi:putative phosphoesterase
LSESNTSARAVIGVISDTHGLMRREALDVLRGCDRIIHAGDVGSPDVLDALRALAPTFAVRGNVDAGDWASGLPMTELVEAGEALIHVLHDVSELDFDPGDAGFAAVVFGHSHQPLIERRKGVLFLNPGSAGPRRFKLPIAVARIEARGRELHPEIIELHI